MNAIYVAARERVDDPEYSDRVEVCSRHVVWSAMRGEEVENFVVEGHYEKHCVDCKEEE